MQKDLQVSTVPRECRELDNDDDLYVPAFVIPGTRRNQVHDSTTDGGRDPGTKNSKDNLQSELSLMESLRPRNGVRWDMARDDQDGS